MKPVLSLLTWRYLAFLFSLAALHIDLYCYRERERIRIIQSDTSCMIRAPPNYKLMFSEITGQCIVYCMVQFILTAADYLSLSRLVLSWLFCCCLQGTRRPTHFIFVHFFDRIKPDSLFHLHAVGVLEHLWFVRVN